MNAVTSFLLSMGCACFGVGPERSPPPVLVEVTAGVAPVELLAVPGPSCCLDAGATVKAYRHPAHCHCRRHRHRGC